MDEAEAQDTAIASSRSQSSAAGPDVPPDLAARDTEFAAFYRGYVPRLVAFLRWQGVPLPEAVDLVQENVGSAHSSNRRRPGP
jgi:hypothetical protein